MNYYERYCGDYQRDTADLSLIEHGAYTQLLDSYYSLEMPLAAEMARLHRVCRAVTAEERNAVEYVVEKFFPLGSDGLRHNPRADAEISKAQTRIETAQRNGKLGGRRPGKNPPGNPGGNPGGSPPPSPAASQTVPQRKPDGQAHHVPDPIHHSDPEKQRSDFEKWQSARGEDGAPLPENFDDRMRRCGEISVLLRGLQVGATSTQQHVLAWADGGVTDAQLAEAVAIARLRKPAPDVIATGYLATILPDVLNPPPPKAPAWDTSHQSIEREARRLGISESRWPQTHKELAAMCHAMNRRKEAA